MLSWRQEREEKVAADSLEGQNLGKYRVLEALGRGGMARVYRAYHPQLDRYVAIKVLRSDLVEEEEFLARFKREARAVAALRHANIVQVFDFDARDDLYYMVMELLEGDTLAKRLDDYHLREERVPQGEMVRILLDVLDGLAYAHSEGMIHRDVKPANILLTRRGQAVLTDFGIAQIIGGTRYTVSGALMGTLSYMSPEQGLEGHCDVRSDIYSLGIVLYEMLLGAPPFDAETPLAILMKHVNDPLPLPRQEDPSVPEPLERVVLKALAKRPGDRYQSAEEMARALQAASEEVGIELPARISLPLSFTTAEAPSESVAVLSGSARQKAVAIERAGEDTDAALGEKLAAEVAAAGRSSAAGPAAPEDRPASPQPGEEASLPAAGGAPMGRRVVVGLRTSDSVREAILKALGLVVAGNLVAVFVGLITGWWGIFGRGWPFELLLVGLGLSLIMEVSGSIWLLIPTGIVLGNGYLMSFYAITATWPWWSFLWPLEPLLVAGAIIVPVRLAREGERAARVARQVAAAVWRPSLVLAGLVMLLGAILGPAS
jgi:tRNA A-37 threonylcarbamoyl transferase component Bud32